MIFLSIATLFLGFYALWKGSDTLISGATTLALRFNIPTFVIGFTVIAIGTSLPELVVNMIATLSAEPKIVYGNIIGSNISNTLLIFGVTAVIGRLYFSRSLFRIDLSLNLFLSLFFIGLLFLISTSSPYLGLSPLKSGVLLLIFVLYLLKLFFRFKGSDDLGEEPSMPLWKGVFFLVFGFAVLFLGGEFVIRSALSLCAYFGIEKSLMSLVVIALGTSLPELATCIVAVRRGAPELAIGNILGSNIFNLYMVLGVCGLVSPLAMPALFTKDLMVMVGGLLLIFTLLLFTRSRSLGRPHGLLLLLAYSLYLGFLLL